MIMKAKKDNTNLPKAKLLRGQKSKEKKNDLSGYPAYPADEDIYSKYKEEKDINPEDISNIHGKKDDKDLNDDVSGSNLDVPGAELDDNQEDVGSEDEENNYYSIGGENHNNLEEDNGD